MAAEVEDDAFFADLSKQIAMLIMEDEEEFPAHSPPLQVQEIPHMLPHHMMALPPYMNEVALYRRESRGTGVFIPKSTPAAPRRKSSRPKRSSPSMEVNSPIQRSAAAAARVTNSSSATAMHLNHGCYSSTGVLKRHK